MTKSAIPKYVHCASISDGALRDRKRTLAASNCDTTLPMAWIPWDKFSRTSAYCGGPQRAENGLQAISNVDKPSPTMKLDIKNAGNDARTAEGQKTRVPNP